MPLFQSSDTCATLLPSNKKRHLAIDVAQQSSENIVNKNIILTIDTWSNRKFEGHVLK